MMKRPIRGFAAALLVASSALPAHALTTSVTGGSFSSQSGALTIDFGVSPINNTGPVSAALPSGPGFSYSGGALFNFDASSNLPNGISARPPGSTGNFWSIGNTPVAQQGPGIVSFSAPVSYFGFLWGSPDTYNYVSFYDGNQLLGSFNGSAIKVPANGDQTYARYFNAFAGSGEVITSAVFTSATNAFETDNHAFVTAVPEPETYAMLLAGLGLLRFQARRRKRKEAALA
jgi:hypothetical protein